MATVPRPIPCTYEGDQLTQQRSADPLLRHNVSAHDNIASVYDAKHTEIYNPIEQARLGRVLDDLLVLSGTAPAAVCDFGAGTGNLTLNFLARGCRLTAVDVSARSLEILAHKAQDLGKVSVGLLDSGRIPFSDATFDIIATYSVLHHVPDYLSAIREMARVLRPGGLLYVDHEANDVAWRPDPHLAAYRQQTHLTLREHLWQLFRTRELFTYAFAKTVFMKAFVDRRYEREGDLHVWPDDHIEWDEVLATLQNSGMDVIRKCDYLLYQPRGGLALYEQYKGICSDTKYIFAKKRS